RGRQIMLDRDLAKLYGVETKRLLEQVRRNIDRFPLHFMFQLDEHELHSLRSQIATLNKEPMRKSRGQHIKYKPYVFTEHGVAMLSAVLKSPIAIETSVFIIETFVRYRTHSMSQNTILGDLENLKNQVINHEITINEILKKLEPPFTPQSGIFFNDQVFDAYVFSSELIAKAKKSVILIDNYIDETTLLQLSKRNKVVQCIIYTEKITEQLKLDLAKHNSQYDPIDIRILKNTHDRFLILDEKELYHIGASLKDLGKRWFAFSKMDSILPELLKGLTKIQL
ncbi:MAG: ORF6N domain-containing protein, partial [Sediminibacterium sp.]